MNSSLQFLGDAPILLNYYFSKYVPATYSDPEEPEEFYIESASMRVTVKGEAVQCAVPLESFHQHQIDEWEQAIRDEMEAEYQASCDDQAEQRHLDSLDR